jgi:hypothetical protein
MMDDLQNDNVRQKDRTPSILFGLLDHPQSFHIQLLNLYLQEYTNPSLTNHPWLDMILYFELYNHDGRERLSYSSTNLADMF